MNPTYKEIMRYERNETRRVVSPLEFKCGRQKRRERRAKQRARA